MAPASQPVAPLRLVRAQRSSPVLVGRERELGQLRRALAAAANGGSAAFIFGEPGIGKSRLLDELREAAALPSDRFLVGACPPVSSLASPYGPFTSALRSVSRQRGRAWLGRRLGARVGDLAPVVPALTEVGLAVLGPEETRARLFEAVHELLEALAADGPIVLGIEDVHWATDSTIALLAALVADLPDGLLLITTAREEGLGGSAAQVVAEATRIIGRVVIRPAPFSEEEIAELASNIVGQPLPPQSVREIRDRSGGNPFLVEELLSGGDGRSPSTTLSLRLASLDDTARAVTGLVATNAEPIGLDLLSRAAALPEAELQASIRAGESVGLLTLDRRDSSYRCRHALVREAVTDALAPIERRGLHARLAGAMEGRGLTEPGDVGRAAAHWLDAGEPVRAIPLLLRSSDEMARAGGVVEAIATSERALAALHGLAPNAVAGVTEAGILGRIAGLLAAKGDGQAADERFVQAVSRSRDEEERLLLVATRAQWLWFSGLERQAKPFRRELAEVGERRGRRIRSLDLLGSVVRAMVGESRFGAAEPLARLALRRARLAGRTDIEAGALAALALLHGFTHRAAEGIHTMRLAGDLAAANGDLEQFMLAAGNHVGLLVDAERHDEVLPAIEHWLEVSRRLRLGLLIQDLELMRIEELLWLGRWTEAGTRLGDLEARAQVTPGMRLKVSLVRLAIAVGRGQLQEAEAELAATAELAPTALQAHYAGPAAYWQARWALASREPDKAAEIAEAGLATLTTAVENGRWYELWATAVSAHARRLERGMPGGRADLARLRRLERGRRAVTNASGLNPAAVAACRASVAAEIAAVRGVDAAAHWEEAAWHWERTRNPAMAAAAWLSAAQANALATRAPAARRAARRAIDLGAPMGMRPLLDAASTVLEHADRRRHEGLRLDDGQSLTKRELDVLRLIAEGRTNREIANALVIGEKTAATHVSNLLAKLGATRRTEAAVAAVRLGIVVPGEPTPG